MGWLALIVDWPNGNVPWECWRSVWRSDIRREPDVRIMRSISPDSSLSGNQAIKTALAKGATEIIYLCADQTVPPDILARFRAHNKDVVGALTATRQRSKGHEWIIYDYNENGAITPVNPTEPLQKVDVVGIGCSYYKAEVFKKIPPPWFMNITSLDGCDLLVSSDFYFFRKCKEYGVETYIDATVESDHQYEVTLNAKSLHRAAPFLMEVC